MRKGVCEVRLKQAMTQLRFAVSSGSRELWLDVGTHAVEGIVAHLPWPALRDTVAATLLDFSMV